MDYTFLLASIENILGKSHKRARENYAFNCPFCNHRKPKLEINMHTNEEGKNFWECWVCQTRGQTIRSLLYQLKTPKEEAQNVLKYLPKGAQAQYQQLSIVELPKEYQPLYKASDKSVIANMVKNIYMNEDLPIMILLNIALGTQTLETMEEESLSQVILNPINSTFLLHELMMETILSTKIQKLPKT